MSGPLIKNENFRSFLAGMLVMLIIFYWIWKLHPTIDRAETRSLPITVACTHDQKPFTSVLTEDKLISEPIKPKKGDKEGETETGTGTGTGTGETGTGTGTPPPLTPPDGPDGPDEVDEGEVILTPPDEVEVTTEEGHIPSGIFVPNNGTPTTERDADIPSTITTPEQGSNSNENGILNIRVPRKIKYQ